jgi:hypothetical protein
MSRAPAARRSPEPTFHRLSSPVLPASSKKRATDPPASAAAVSAALALDPRLVPSSTITAGRTGMKRTRWVRERMVGAARRGTVVTSTR